jgi:hypothetical protein
MNQPSLLEQAKAGEADEIAALLNRNLQSQGIQVRAAREAYQLTLWVESTALPPPDTVVSDLRRTIEKLDIPSLGILTIIGQVAGAATPSWREEFSLLAAYAEGQGAIGNGMAASVPHPVAGPPTAAVMATSIEAQAVIEAAYAVLDLPGAASLSEVDGAYLRLKSLMRKQGNRNGIATLQSAHQTLRQHLAALAQSPISRDLSSSTRPKAPAELLEILFRQQSLPVGVRLEGSHLQIQLSNSQIKSPRQVMAKICTLLKQTGRAMIGSAEIEQVTVYGLNSHKKVVWKRTVAGSRLGLTADATNAWSSITTIATFLSFRPWRFR